MAVDEARPATSSPVRRLPRLLVVVGIGLFVALLAYGLSVKSPDDTIDERLAEGRTAAAPDFSLELLEGDTAPTQIGPGFSRAAADGRLDLRELRGAPVVINFWASWCPPCRDESDVLEAGWRRWARRGVLFLGIDMQDLRGDARTFLREVGITYPSVRDPGKEVSRDYGATGIPETYFVSARGRVVGHVAGVVSREQLDSGVAGARAGQPVGKAKGGARRKPR